MKQFIYQGNEVRADKGISILLGVSRNTVEHLFDAKRIKICGLEVKKSSILRTGSIVEVDDLVIDNQDKYIIDNSAAIDLKVVYQSSDYRVIIKPRGVLTHPTSIRELDQPSVAGFIIQQGLMVPSASGGIRSGIVHRLDKETEGLMIIATSQRGMTYFGNLFQEKSSGNADLFKKEYTALCKPNQQGVGFIYHNSFPFYYESETEPKTPHPIKKLAKSTIISLKNGPAFSHVKIEIITGRTHQIRIQLSQLGLPIVGDTLYGTTGKFLHLTASRLEFVDLDGLNQQFTYSEDWH